MKLNNFEFKLLIIGILFGSLITFSVFYAYHLDEIRKIEYRILLDLYKR